ncbi:MAG: 50S ribosomal protein L22 [Patescibacteria group bacterium]
MEVKASLKHLRMSPRKARLVIDVVRQMSVDKALDQLKFINKLAAVPIAKLIKSAIANAQNTYSLEASNLYIKEIRSDEGVMLKRWMPRAHGRATSIRKRGCHISLILAEIKETGKAEKKVLKVADPVKLEKLAKEGENAMSKAKAKADKEKVKRSAGEKTKMFRRKAG